MRRKDEDGLENEGGRCSLREEKMGKEGLGGAERCAPLEERQGAPRLEGQGPRGRGGGPELTARFSLPPPLVRPHL